MKRGKLTQQDKYIIQGMHKDGKSIDDIAQSIDRSTTCVSGYIERELNDIIETITNVKIEQFEQEKSKPDKDPNVYKNHLVTETESGRKGMVIMTQTASERSDAASSVNRNAAKSRRNKNKIFNIQEGRMEE